MPSPFPGMDPYLEGDEWISVHTTFSIEIARQLAPKLRPKYIVRTPQRFITEFPDNISISTGTIYPEVGVFPSGSPVSVGETSALFSPPLELATVVPTSVPHVTVEIRDVANRELVTAIEVLSPTNKRGAGYDEYLEKRGRILRSLAHLIEIDLLREGKRVPMQEPLPPAPYFVLIGRATKRPVLDVWPIQLDMRLPVIPVPLLAADEDVTVDLQAALDTVYDSFSYDLSIDYTQPPRVPLVGKAAEWAAALLRARGAAGATG